MKTWTENHLNDSPYYVRPDLRNGWVVLMSNDEGDLVRVGPTSDTRSDAVTKAEWYDEVANGGG